MQPNGLLWAQMDRVALTWMNAYIHGIPVTERAGYQVETNAFWYNALCFAIDMESRFGSKDGSFTARWTPVRDMVKENYMPMFWNASRGCLADYVDGAGQNMDIRPNQLYAIWVVGLRELLDAEVIHTELASTVRASDLGAIALDGTRADTQREGLACP